MKILSPQTLLERSTAIHSAESVATAIAQMAADVTALLKDDSPVVICVMGGGVVFTGQLLTQLNFPLELDYVHASRYENQTIGKALVWKALPKLDLTGRTVLLLDDILDEGITLKEIQDKCYALGAAKVLTAVLIEKKLDHPKPITADFIGLEVPNEYVFGCGMDVYGWWRNLPSIYALRS